MIQHKLKLSNDFKQHLINCEEVWIAVAMVSDGGFRYIQDNINKTAKQNFLVGIGLPTSPKVLEYLKEFEGKGIFNSRLYHKAGELFHPKVYILKSNDRLTAYVGSGNCTIGGMEKNIELSVKTDDQEFCIGLVKWFNTLFKHSREITDDFLLSYRLIYDNRVKRLNLELQELNSIFPEENGLRLDNIDFTNQFFKKEDFEAFEGTKPWDTSDTANQGRIRVRNKLFKLNDKLLPEIKAKKWNLSEHYEFNDIVSSAIHGIYTSDQLSAIWLHYGRNKKEIKAYGENQTPLDYMRLQVIVHKGDVGIWNRIGKDNGSRIDRDNLKNRLKKESSFRTSFFKMITELPEQYFIRRNNEKRHVHEFVSEEQLTDYLLEDNSKHYFIIGIEFNPGDRRLSEKNIVSTVMLNLGLLYPSYKLIKHELQKI